MWTARDCELVHRNGSHARCRCSRTGTFGVLMDASPREVDLCSVAQRSGKSKGQGRSPPGIPVTTLNSTAARGRPRVAGGVHSRGPGSVCGCSGTDGGCPAEHAQPQVQCARDPCQRGSCPGSGRAPLLAGNPQDPQPGAGPGPGELCPSDSTFPWKASGQSSGSKIRDAQ